MFLSGFGIYMRIRGSWTGCCCDQKREQENGDNANSSLSSTLSAERIATMFSFLRGEMSDCEARHEKD